MGGGGQTKRVNPLTYNGGLGRVRTPLRRGGGFVYGGLDLHGKKKGKKGSISSIFQTSVTALAFLAFGGYVMCLIVQAIRAKNNGLAMMNGAALHGNLSRFVFLGRRPGYGKRRKRDSTEETKAGGNLKESSEGPEEIEFNDMETGDHSDEATLETSEDDKSGTDDMQHTNAFYEDGMDLGHWPLANADDMYRALVMISEGYSLYHQTLHNVYGNRD